MPAIAFFIHRLMFAGLARSYTTSNICSELHKTASCAANASLGAGLLVAGLLVAAL